MFNEADQSQENEFFSQNFTKDQKIKKLIDRNTLLQTQVMKVERALISSASKPTYGLQLPQIKQDLANKELQNAYKMIRHYEYEMNKRKSNEYENTFVDEVRKYQKNYQQKKQIVIKLQKQIKEHKRATVDHTRLLKDDALKSKNQNLTAKIISDIQYTKQRIKQTIIKGQAIQNKIKKHASNVLRFQQQILQQENGKQTLQSIKAKKIRPQNNDNNLVFQKEDITNSQGFTLCNFPNLNSINNFNTAKNEIRVLKKLQKDYEIKMAKIIKQKNDGIDKNLASRNHILETQYEIEECQRKIQQLKLLIDPRALKPRLSPQLNRFASMPQMRAKTIKPCIPHPFKFIQEGAWTKKGKRFSDRTTIGREVSKIIGIKSLQNTEGILVGLQTTYDVKGCQKTGVLYKVTQQNVVVKETVLNQGDYIRYIDCMLDQNKIIVGLALVSARNIAIKMGKVTEKRIPITMQSNQYPICFYGCLLEKGFQMFGVEVATL